MSGADQPVESAGNSTEKCQKKDDQLPVWPSQGSDIRIWSLLSRKKDGFWQVREKISGDKFLVDARGTYDTKSKFRFYAVPQPDPEEVIPDDSTPAWLGIPGQSIGRSADQNKIYMLQWTEKDGVKTIQAKGFEAPEDPRDPPVVNDEKEALHMTFLIEFFSARMYVNFRDFNHLVPGAPGNNYVKTRSKGIIDRLPVERENLISSWSTDPGLQYYMTAV
ncbi:uncharacterized protein [Ptychodera flava]|uniref:uncharacterized protein isoform X1 n=1 Tax=Ptychodera flava TaxID=63121 RepID=UPI00396A7DA2